jgi:hypothetical protein
MQITSDSDKKKYIINNWSTSNGKRITEMLGRYWSASSNGNTPPNVGGASPSNKNAPATQQEIEDIFGINATQAQR